MLDEDLSEPATAAGLHEKEKNHAYAFALLCLSWKHARASVVLSCAASTCHAMPHEIFTARLCESSITTC